MKPDSILKPHLILTRALKRKQKAFSGYSRRALARDLGVSSAFVTKILTGVRNLPAERIKRMARLLDMDLSEQENLVQSIIVHTIKSPELRAIARKSSGHLNSQMDIYGRCDRTQFGVLREWYNIAILDMVTCKNFDPDTSKIASKLGIHIRQAQESLDGLSKAGLIERIGDTYRKVEGETFFPATKSLPEIRNFQKQMIQKALVTLSSAEQSEYERRLITGFTIAANREHLETIKKMIFDFLSLASTTLSQGDCEEVYQLNVQFFPLTKMEPR